MNGIFTGNHPRSEFYQENAFPVGQRIVEVGVVLPRVLELMKKNPHKALRLIEAIFAATAHDDSHVVIQTVTKYLAFELLNRMGDEDVD